MENIKKRKFPKSINNRQCLGPCYKPDTSFIHPVLLVPVKNDLYPGKAVCPTTKYEKVDEFSQKTFNPAYDVCNNPTHDEDTSTQESLLTFQSGFTKNIFLSQYYNINSFEDALEWIDENKFTPIETRERILNAALNLYGDNIMYFDDIFVDFYISYIKDKYINNIYKDIHENIGIKNEEILIVDKEKNKLKINEFNIERINYIAKVFLDKLEVRKFLSKYIKSQNIHFSDYDNMLHLIYTNHIIYIKNIIKHILSN
jgi:hypothetical protein